MSTPRRWSCSSATTAAGLQGGRSDSHGLKIMKERARLIGADLEVRDGVLGGVQVSVRIGPGRPTPGRGDSPVEHASATMDPS